MLEHIQRGDIYEANFCMEFFAENAQIEPLAILKKTKSPSFNSAFLRGIHKGKISLDPPVKL
jgi:anthranilate/para-aminobenzoate synthase component I